MELVFTKLAREDPDALPKQIRDRIIKKTEWYASQPMPLVFAKRLSGDLSELFRFRVGDYRVIVLPDGIVLSVQRVQKRSEVYRKA